MPNAELKRAALVLSFSTLRVSELGQVTIKDLILPTGELKSELPLRAALCKRQAESSLAQFSGAEGYPRVVGVPES